MSQSNIKSYFKFESVNWGIVVSVIILLVLLVLNYNRCFLSANIFATQEGFAGADTIPTVDFSKSTQATQITTANALSNTSLNSSAANKGEPPTNVRISVTVNSCTIYFSMDTSNNKPKPLKFLVVLAQYDKNKNNIGANNFYLSDEFVLNNTQAANPNINQNLCTIVDGNPVCQYTFTNLQATDSYGDAYLYRVGISAIYANNNSDFASPENITNQYFILNTSIENQTIEYNNYLTFKQQSQNLEAGGRNSSNSKNILSTADGQYELIKQQLGDYPNNLDVSNDTVRQNTLTDLIDKSMSFGKMIVNVDSSLPNKS